MKYETPLCEVVRIEEVDIIRTSPNQDNTDSPVIDWDLDITV